MTSSVSAICPTTALFMLPDLCVFCSSSNVFLHGKHFLLLRAWLRYFHPSDVCYFDWVAKTCPRFAWAQFCSQLAKDPDLNSDPVIRLFHQWIFVYTICSYEGSNMRSRCLYYNTKRHHGMSLEVITSSDSTQSSHIICHKVYWLWLFWNYLLTFLTLTYISLNPGLLIFWMCVL